MLRLTPFLRAVACARARALHASAPSFSLPDVYDLRREGAAIQVPKPPKRPTKVAAHTVARLAVVRAGLASQEKRVADHKKTLPQKVRNHGLLYLIKKAAWEKGEGEE
jgi:hypothetical protein